MTLPAADVQEYVKSAQKEERGQTWGLVEALTDQQADRIMKCPTMRKRILRSRACYRNKSRIPGKLVAKTRVVALGHLDPDLTTISRDSPTPTRTSEYVLLAIFTSGINKMVQNTKAKWLLWCGDVSTAFLQGQPDADERPDDLYLLPPQDGLARLAGIFRAKVRGNIYGLASAPRTWTKEVTRRVLSVGYKQHALDKMMFYKHDSAGNLMCAVIVYVDDFLLTCVETYDKEELLSLFTWGSKTQLDLTTPIEFKGKEYTLVTDNSGYLVKVTQKKFINTTPAPRKITKREPDDPLNFEERADFKSVSGSLQWLSAQCRPDVSAWVSLCAVRRPSRTCRPCMRPSTTLSPPRTTGSLFRTSRSTTAPSSSATRTALGLTPNKALHSKAPWCSSRAPTAQRPRQRPAWLTGVATGAAEFVAALWLLRPLHATIASTGPTS